jgi:cell division protein FtsB
MALTENRPLRQTSLALPAVGLILIVSFWFDFIVRLFFTPSDKPDVQVGLLNEFIDRGVIALIGLALIYAGFWLNNLVSRRKSESKEGAPWQNPQFWTFVFATLMGLIFLILMPVHFGVTGKILNETATRFDQQEAQAKAMLDQQKRQAAQIVASGQIDELLKDPNIQPQQRALFEELKKNPKALETKVSEQLAGMQKEKSDTTGKLNKEMTLNRVRAELRSLLLALGFTVIGWTGLRDAR